MESMVLIIDEKVVKIATNHRLEQIDFDNEE